MWARNIWTYPLVSPRKSTIDTDLPARINHASHNSVTNLPARNQSSISLTKLSRKERKHPCKSICKGPLPLRSRLAPPYEPLGRQFQIAWRCPFYCRAPLYQRPSLFVAYRLAELLLPLGATPVKIIFYWFIHFQGFQPHPVKQSYIQILKFKCIYIYNTSSHRIIKQSIKASTHVYILEFKHTLISSIVMQATLTTSIAIIPLLHLFIETLFS